MRAAASPSLPAPADPPRRRRSRRAEAAILESTLALLGEVGFSGLTIDGIAARAGVGKATIYRHWRSKAELVIEAFRRYAPPFPTPDTGTMRGDLAALLHHLVDGLARSPLAGILPSLVQAAEIDPEVGRLYAAFAAERREVVRNVLHRAARRGELRAGVDHEIVIDLVVSPVFARRLVTRQPLDAAFADALLDAVWPALSPPPAG
jgi:AcrR family transcriptional regulator